MQKPLSILVATLLFLYGCDSNQNGSKATSDLTIRPSFEQQLETFKQLGFILNHGIDTSDINRWPDGHKEFEKNPYKLLYQTLGQTTEKEPFDPMTDKAWNVDLEMIE